MRFIIEMHRQAFRVMKDVAGPRGWRNFNYGTDGTKMMMLFGFWAMVLSGVGAILALR